MANANSMTIADKFNAIINACEDAGVEIDLEGQTVREFLEDRIEKAKKKSSAKKEPTDEQKEVRDEIVKVLTDATAPMSISEMQKVSTVLGGCSTSRVTANLGTMLINGKNPNPDGIIMRLMDKKVAKFSLA